MTTFRDKLIARYSRLIQVGVRFRNNQTPRMSGQGFGADPSVDSLSLMEFCESYFGRSRLDQEWFGDDEDEFELEHMGNVLGDNLIK